MGAKSKVYDATWNPVQGCGKEFYDPMHWRKPRRILVVGGVWDMFHKSVPYVWVDQVFAVMATCPQHTFMVLTKDALRMLAYVGSRVGQPLRNVWLGCSCENQAAADERIPYLLATPTALRFISCEPLLGAVDLAVSLAVAANSTNTVQWRTAWRGFIDWVIVGGESGPQARPMHPDWVRSLRDQCRAGSVPFFFTGWGEWKPVSTASGIQKSLLCQYDTKTRFGFVRNANHFRVLDGVEHDGMPEVTR